MPPKKPTTSRIPEHTKLIFKRQGRKRILHTRNARSLIAENPRLLKEFRFARKKILRRQAGAEFTAGNVTVKKIRGDYFGTRYFMVEFGKNRFFVKETSKGEPRSGQPIAQMKRMKKAWHVLKKEGIEPIQYELGLDLEKGKKFLVSKFYDFLRVDELEDIDTARYSKMLKKSNEINDKLAKAKIGGFDVGINNLFYDCKNRRLLAFDL